MTVQDLLTKYNLTKTALSVHFGIPYRTIQNWCSDTGNARKCPEYVVKMMDEQLKQSEAIEKTKSILWKYSQIDGAHHKTWCLDHIARAIYGDEYSDFVRKYEYYNEESEEFEDEKIYEWDEGIAP